ncbi:MAG: cysteine-rich small domain-containing protein [Clostridiales bacterium]|jgi:Zn-finger protein|nr:cysteine-rich small domain-containing protein [Clostridiales bacterium]
MRPKNSYRYFANVDCQFYPTCHGGIDKNCMFCYCPLYRLDCKGNFKILENGLKDCGGCLVPHMPEGYDYIMSFLMKK